MPAAIYLLYAKLEEEFGLARHAMGVYERATRAVLPAQQHDMFNIYIKRAAELYGVTHTRPIYQKAIEVGAEGAPKRVRGDLGGYYMGIGGTQGDAGWVGGPGDAVGTRRHRTELGGDVVWA